MKEEYDFSKGERGKFYKPDLEPRIPVYLQKDIGEFLQTLASEKGTDVGDHRQRLAPTKHQPGRNDEVASIGAKPNSSF